METNKYMEDGAKEISERFGCSVLIKGGHMVSCDHSRDVLKTAEGDTIWFESKRVDNPNTHGTGCTLSSAIASFLALGHSLEESISMAKDYLFRSIKEDLDLGKGHGPLWHIFYK